MTFRQGLFRLPDRSVLLTLLVLLAGVTGAGWLGMALVADPAGPGSPATGEPGPALRVVSADGQVFLNLPLDHGLVWEIQWRHSVAGITVRDRFALRDGQMTLTDSFTPLLDVAGLGNMGDRGELRTTGPGATGLRKSMKRSRATAIGCASAPGGRRPILSMLGEPIPCPRIMPAFLHELRSFCHDR